MEEDSACECYEEQRSEVYPFNSFCMWKEVVVQRTIRVYKRCNA
jgi:hypothetical protein